MKKVLIMLERWILPILVLLVLILFSLSVLEKMAADVAVTAFKAAVQALTLDSPEDGFTLYMNFSIKVTLAWAAIKVYMAAVGLKWDNVMARRMARNHIVIAAGARSADGDGDQSPRSKLALAIDLAYSLSSSETIVLTAPEIDEIQRTKLWDSGVKVVTHDGNFTDVLEAVGAARAKTLIAMRDHFDDNVILCRVALSPSLKNLSLQCKCMIEPLAEKRIFRAEDYFEAEMLSRLRVFNESELIARRIFNEFPPDVNVAQTDQRVHVLLVGLSSVGQAIVQQMARMGHYRSGLKPKITIVDRDIEAKWSSLSFSLPAVEDCIVVEKIEIDVDHITPKMLDQWLEDADPITMVYVCRKNEISNLRIARLLLNRQIEKARQKNMTIADVVALDPPGGSVLSDFYIFGNHGGHFHLFSLVGVDGNAEGSAVSGCLLTDIDDSWARSIHDAYRAKDLAKIEQNPDHQIHPNSRPWDDLPENIRDANRMVADHFEIKMRAVGCRLGVIDEVQEITLSKDELEVLSIMEHGRWWADRALNGWRVGSTRDDAQKIHPNMVPYEDLSEADKQKDRDSVMEMTKIMRAEGMVITRD
jgi:hypothetical protein